MSTRNTKSFPITLSLVFILLLAVLSFGIYEIGAINKETSRLINEADNTARKGDLAQSLRVLQSSAIDDIATFDSLVFTSDKLVFLIEKVEEAGRKLGLETTIVSVEEEEGAENAPSNLVKITVEVEGSWSGAFSFLHATESLPQRVMVDELSLSKIGDGWRLRITFSVHSFN